jgi:hypothetical protein
MTRINLPATIEGIEFPDEIWGWPDVLGDAIRLTEAEARAREKGFVADTPYKQVLLGGIHTYLSGLKAVYSLLRTELVSQAAGQARLLCEGVITLAYISYDPEQRSVEFLEYSTIEAFEAADALIEWESQTAEAAPAAAVTAIREALRPEYEVIRTKYQYTDKKGKTRRHKNWANRSIADMARVSEETTRLYELIYRQLSSYVHGSAWSFRHIPAYTPQYYDANIVLGDIAQVTLGTLVVWQVFAAFVSTHLGWGMGAAVAAVSDTVHALSKVTSVRQSIPTSSAVPPKSENG